MHRASDLDDDANRLTKSGRNGVALAAAGLAVAYLLAALALPGALPIVTAAAAAGGCALVLARRGGRGLSLALSAITVWLAAGLGGALLLGEHPAAGPLWLAGVLFLVPLPLVPWLYARTFPGRNADAGGEDREREGRP